MAMTDRKTLPILAAPALLAACAGPAHDYPSLAIRDVERVVGSFEPVASAQLDVPPVEVQFSGALAVHLETLVGQARSGHQSFLDAAPDAQRKVAAAAGAGVGSDAWAIAQVALAGLDSARSESAVALADLDLLHAARTVQAQDASAIDTARDVVLALLAEEDAALEGLRARLR